MAHEFCRCELSSLLTGLHLRAERAASPNEILRGVDHGIVILAAADVPASTVDLLALETLADKTVFKLPPGDRFVTLKSAWGATGEQTFHGFLYAAVSGDDNMVFDSPGEFTTVVNDPLGHIANDNIGVQQINMERVRVNFTGTHYLTIILTGFPDVDLEDDGRFYIDFEDV